MGGYASVRVYVDRHATRIGYLHGIWRDEVDQRSSVLLELRFFSGVHRDHFFAVVDSYFMQYTEVGIDLREDLAGFRPYDQDGGDARHALWGNRNIHEEWMHGANGAEGDTEIGGRAPFFV
jgi:hypothetical protein